MAATARLISRKRVKAAKRGQEGGSVSAVPHSQETIGTANPRVINKTCSKINSHTQRPSRFDKTRRRSEQVFVRRIIYKIM